MELSKTEFDAEMNELDLRFGSEDVAIPGRPTQAMIAIFKKHGKSGMLFHPFEENLDFPVTPENLSDHVHNWYEGRYGEQLCIETSPGRFPFLLGGNAYECRVPLILGRVHILASKSKFNSPDLVNAVEHLVNLPAFVRESMSSEQEGELQAVFVTVLEAATELNEVKSELSKSAATDSRIASDLVCGLEKNPSLSTWHSLQFAEKVLKIFISGHEQFQYTHDVEKLRSRASELGYIADPRINWELLNIQPAVRYKFEGVSLASAQATCIEAWRVAFNVLKQIEA